LKPIRRIGQLVKGAQHASNSVCCKNVPQLVKPSALAATIPGTCRKSAEAIQRVGRQWWKQLPSSDGKAPLMAENCFSPRAPTHIPLGQPANWG